MRGSSRENLAARDEGTRAIKPCTIKVLGQMALFEAGAPLSLVMTNDVDVYADYEHSVERELARLLAKAGKELDPLGHEIWMPSETRYDVAFEGRFVTLSIADVDAVLVSKARMAPEKNRAAHRRVPRARGVGAVPFARQEVPRRSRGVLAMTDLKQLAERRHAATLKKRRDPRYVRVLGRLVTAKVLTTDRRSPRASRADHRTDALWAGALEPRILEVLPALLVKRPSLFVDPDDLPADLAAVVQALRKNQTSPAFRGIPPHALARWVPSVGHRGKRVSQLKSFRLQAEDTELLERLARELQLSQTAVIRRGLRRLAGDLLER